MTTRLQRLSLVLSLASVGIACAEPPEEAAFKFLSPQEAIEKMKFPEGFVVNAFAAEPGCQQPFAFTFDERGRVWMCENLNYETRKSDLYKLGPQGRIVILTDTDGDGQMDDATAIGALKRFEIEGEIGQFVLIQRLDIDAARRHHMKQAFLVAMDGLADADRTAHHIEPTLLLIHPGAQASGPGELEKRNGVELLRHRPCQRGDALLRHFVTEGRDDDKTRDRAFGRRHGKFVDGDALGACWIA